ncbi:Inositol phoshorylceramide synthase regulatory subunit kei1 [Grifola frondosa]|uniref:Inositol phoshorylceramide synthase regulatory subunit kei1 n=1 Tax=Grifola frondosa TaxID=5627 RepID=A0A1C7MAE6_GRIFR|nr:Inositol phoshorylceramide synthase regulatory subunit kei1 [Grifola frondosa]
MKLTLRPEWRLRPLTSFLGFLDIKTGVIIALLFALLNKVAGVYGLVAVLTGAGGSAAQLSLYIYSVLGLVALAWGLKATTQEDPKHTLYFAHLFFADHILSTAWLVFFAVLWWFYTPHDGRRQANSDAQKDVMNSGSGNQNMTELERTEAAMLLWNAEKNVATAVIVIGWLAKIYFAVLLYSYAIHLRKGSYRSLPRSRSFTPNGVANGTTYSALPDEEELEVEDFYRLPVRAPAAQSPAHTPSSSLSGFADFVSAPGRARRGKPGKSNLSFGGGRIGNGRANGDAGDTEVLFDEEEVMEEVGIRDGRDEVRTPLVGGQNHSRKQSRSRD